MFGGQAHPQVTIRSIVNRGGEQGAQHSQLLHSWFAHIPGLRVVMPYSVSDARNLLIASVLCKDPVIFIDDRWLYDQMDEISKIEILDLKTQSPKVILKGESATVVASVYSTKLAKDAIKTFLQNHPCKGIELIDLRIISPLDINPIINSVKKITKRTS